MSEIKQPANVPLYVGGVVAYIVISSREEHPLNPFVILVIVAGITAFVRCVQFLKPPAPEVPSKEVTEPRSFISGMGVP